MGKKIFPRVQLRLYKEKEEVLEYTVVDGWQRPTARDDSESIPALAVTRRDGAEIRDEVLGRENVCWMGFTTMKRTYFADHHTVVWGPD